MTFKISARLLRKKAMNSDAGLTVQTNRSGYCKSPLFEMNRLEVLTSMNDLGRVLLENHSLLKIKNSGAIGPVSGFDEFIWRRCVSNLKREARSIPFALRSSDKVYACIFRKVDPECLQLIVAPENTDANIGLRGLGATYGLTSAECDVVAMLCNGIKPKVISETLRRSESTIRSHVRSALCKTDLHSIQELICVILRLPEIEHA